MRECWECWEEGEGCPGENRGSDCHYVRYRATDM